MMSAKTTGARAMARVALATRPEALLRFLRNDDGVAFIEAAFIFPVMVGILGLGVIWGQGYDIKRKVEQAAHTVTDIVAQDNSSYDTGGYIAQVDLQAMLQYSSAVMLPYSWNKTGLISVVVSELQANQAGTLGTVVWSEKAYSGVERVVGSTVPLTVGTIAPNGYVLLGEVSYSYTPLNIGFIPVTTMALTDSIFMAPRQDTCVPIYKYHTNLPAGVTCQ